MGSNAFPTLADDEASSRFPRIPDAIYWCVLNRSRTALASLYRRVVCPQTAPGKLDHGDVDLLVALPLQRNVWPTEQQVGQLLSANDRRSIGPTWNFAVSLGPTNFPEIEDEVKALMSPDPHVQIDIHVSSSDEGLNWRVFKHSYGDLWSILGLIIRPYGLTADDNGLCVRLKELEDDLGPREKARVRLTDIPSEAMCFLGLDAEWFEGGFRTEEEVFNFATSCRLFSTTSFVKSTVAADAKYREDSSNINKGDRHRAKTRHMFRRFLDWLVRNLETLEVYNTELTREDIIAESVTRYGKQQTVDNILHSHRRQLGEARLRKRVADAIPASYKGNARTAIMRGLRLHVGVDEQGQPIVKRALEQRCHRRGLDGNESGEPENKVNQKSQEARLWTDSALSEDELLIWLMMRLPEIEGLETARRAISAKPKAESSMDEGEANMLTLQVSDDPI